MNSLRSSQVSGVSCSSIKEKLKGKIPICNKCNVERLHHYCIEKKCTRRELLCVTCDVDSHLGMHFTHRFCYVLPLLIKAVCKNMEEASEYIREFKNNIAQEISKVESYAKSLEGMLVRIEDSIRALEQEKLARGLDNFENDVEKLLAGENINLQNIFKGVDFMTNAECKAKIEAFKKDMLTEVNKLVWLADPQKGLKQFLSDKEKDEQEAKPELTFSSNKLVEVQQINPQFKQFYEVYTHKLQQNHVVVKLDNEYGTKQRMFEALLYNFKKCRSLSIHNVNLNHVKSPLHFARLKHLEVVCNNECEQYAYLKTEFVNSIESNITSFSIKRLKEQDSKFLRNIRLVFPHLRELQIELVNKYDLGSNKDLNEFFKGTDPNLMRLSLKFRGEAEVKKLFGNFTKFYKEAAQNPLEEHIIRYLQRHPNLTKVHLEGIRIQKVKELFEVLKAIPNVLDLKVNLMETPETQHAAVKQQTQKIVKGYFINRRIMAVIQSMYNRSSIGRVTGNLITHQIIEMALGL